MWNHLKQQAGKIGFFIRKLKFQAPVVAFRFASRKGGLSVVPGERGLIFLRKKEGRKWEEN